MNARRPAKVQRIESMEGIVWKVKPAGPEQRELERMFRENEIEPGEGPETIRRSNEMFKRFSSAVFGNHFRTTKALFAKEGNFGNFQWFFEVVLFVKIKCLFKLM